MHIQVWAGEEKTCGHRCEIPQSAHCGFIEEDNAQEDEERCLEELDTVLDTKHSDTPPHMTDTKDSKRECIREPNAVSQSQKNHSQYHKRQRSEKELRTQQSIQPRGKSKKNRKKNRKKRKQ